jgi:hypothetical protein
MSSGLLTTLLLIKKRKLYESALENLKECFSRIDTLPSSIINPDLVGNSRYAEHFFSATTDFALQHEENCRKLISDLTPGLKHHDIHVVSIVESFSVLIGMSLDEFSKLLQSLKRELQELFTNSPFILGPEERSIYSSIRMKLFMFLFRMKNGCSFNFMSSLFGWSKSTLQEQFEMILTLVHTAMHRFHKGIFEYLGPEFQTAELFHWNQLHKHVHRDFDNYVQKIREENADAVRKHSAPVIDADSFVGSLGAVDGTYSVRPRVTPAILEANNEDTQDDRMYSEYIKMHAFKLVLCCSHGLTDKYPKLLLNVQIGCGSASDTSVYLLMYDEIKNKLLQGAAFLGDNAFHRTALVLPPYNALQTVASHNAIHCNLFNNRHSHERMTSEHGVKFMKYWGVVRGRSDVRLFEKESLFYDAVFVAQALHNFKALGCPDFSANM